MKQMQRKDRKVMGTAYHEAGHAVVAFALGKGVRSVSIVSDSETFGQVVWSQLDSISEFPDWSRDRALIERTIMCSLAGDIAEAHVFDEASDVRKHGANADFQHALNNAFLLFPRDPEATAFVNWLYERTKTMICGEPYWSAVSAVAEALIVERAISGRKARQIALTAAGGRRLRV